MKDFLVTELLNPSTSSHDRTPMTLEQFRSFKSALKHARKPKDE